MLWYVGRRFPRLQGELLAQAEHFVHKNLEYYNTKKLRPGQEITFFLWLVNRVLCCVTGYFLCFKDPTLDAHSGFKGVTLVV